MEPARNALLQSMNLDYVLKFKMSIFSLGNRRCSETRGGR